MVVTGPATRAARPALEGRGLLLAYGAEAPARGVFADTLRRGGFIDLVAAGGRSELGVLEPVAAGRVARWLESQRVTSSAWEEWWTASALRGAARLAADFDVVAAWIEPIETWRAAVAVTEFFRRPLVIGIPARAASKARSRYELQALRRLAGSATAMIVADEDERQNLVQALPRGSATRVFALTDPAVAAVLQGMCTAHHHVDDGSRVATAKVSVIVPVRDGARHLRHLIPALERQTFPRDRYEVVIADDGSQDGLLDGLEYDESLVRVATAPAVGEFAARNRAVKEASGSLLAFCDADCVPEPDWLANGVQALATADVALGAVRFSVDGKPTTWTILDIEMTKNQELHLRLGQGETVSLFVERETFERVGGFDARFRYYSDFDFIRRCLDIGSRVSFAADARVSHPARRSALPFLRMFWHAHSQFGRLRALEGWAPPRTDLASWVPLVPVLRWRRRLGLPSGLNRAWLTANGVVPTRTRQAVATVALLVVLPYVAAAAELSGWLAAHRSTDELRGQSQTPGEV
jgi:GT2 family glycosyltransferase